MLQIRNLTKQFRHPDGGPLTAVRVEEFAAGPGEQVILAGPSGSGKTTLLHLIAGLMPPTAGEIRWDGEEIGALPEKKRDAWRAHNLGYVFQNFNLLSSLSVMENIMVASVFGGKPFGKEQQSAAAGLLARVGLADRAGAKPFRLSTGEQQRVAVVRALINKPRLILADEPTASLDRSNADIVLELLRRLADECGSTLILATHDPDVVARFPRVFALHRPGGEAI
jgi:ABC-type lipoprotein export system ATPase subunit